MALRGAIRAAAMAAITSRNPYMARVRSTRRRRSRGSPADGFGTGPRATPRDLALLLLAVGSEPPRERARDQRADLLGLDLRRRVLDRIAAIDPEPSEFASCLAALIREFGEPDGPTRAIASGLLQDWESSRIAPEFWPWLVAEAVHASGRGDRPRRRERGGDDVA